MIKWNLIIFISYIIFQYFILSKKNLQNTFFENNQPNEKSNVTCPENCKDGLCDNITLKCDSCIDGYYKDNCSEPCPTKKCLQCVQDNGKCTICKDELIIIDNFCCEKICIKCNDTGCTECDDIKYGLKCNNCPDNCYYNESEKKRKCEQESGNCYSCISGKYSLKCEQNCNEGCDLSKKNCDMNDGTCECKNGYYGDKCENICNDNCEQCDSKNGTCYKCKEGFYPLDKDCIQCPENCEGECPEGKCLKCKDGFFGEICNKKCSIFCKDNICNQTDGLCFDCINHFSKESNCSECINNYDKETNCTKCKSHYDITTECIYCSGNYNISQDCKACINKYDITQDCNSCLYNYDISTECVNCTENYDITQDCKYCLKNYDITTNCEYCINHYNETTSCNLCDEHFTLESDCTQCEAHFTLESDCTKCEAHFTLDSDCTQCEINYDISTNCTSCINQFDYSTNCQDCLKGFYGDNCNEECEKGCNTTINNCKKENGYCEECYLSYYGEKCENKSEIEHCISFNKENGECLKCEETYYLTDKKCEACSINCNNSLCEDYTGRCLSCASFDIYGEKCEKKCSKFCNSFEGNFICDRNNGECFNGCINTGNFLNKQCTECTPGYYPNEGGCYNTCSIHCQDEACSQEDGSCINCETGFWDEKCNTRCNSTTCKKACDKSTGFCFECNDGWYKDPQKDCQKCPVLCTKCINGTYCDECIEERYGHQCEDICSDHCKDHQCDINGNCECKNNYYGEKCSLSCDGCTDKGCYDESGICIDHYCKKNYFDPRMCDKNCGDNCGGDKMCDLYTGECTSCQGNNWGINCEKKCSEECENDGRVDCCYVKENPYPNGINIDIIEHKRINNLGEEQDEFYLFKINLGGYDLTILADFETNSPLVIFDSSIPIKKSDTEIYNISIDTKYNSSNSNSVYINDKSDSAYYAYDGFFLIKERSAKDRLIIDKNTFNNFSFLICEEYKLEKDFDSAGKINGIVGLGLRNYFTENIFWTNLKNKIPKNIIIKSIDENKKKSIYIGDYNEDIRKSFSKLSTMEILNNNEIQMNKTIQYETGFRGIAYSLRKAYEYQYDKRVILNNRIETTIVFNNLYKQFFEKIYFGELFDNGCYYRSVQGGEGEYYCDIGKQKAVQNLPKLGLIMGDYIYYLSYNFLYKESNQFITFIIKLHGQSQQKIELGKSFFNEFSVVYNNGNETLNFFGDIKKLNVPLRNPSNLLNIDEDILTPGGWVTLIIFSTSLFIIICYLSKYCLSKNNNDDSEDDETEEDDDEALIDDTLE